MSGDGRRIPADFSAVDEVWAQRDGARSRLDVAYLVYVVLLSAGVLGAPATRLAAQALARPDVLELLRHESTPPLSVLAAGLAAAGAVVLGATRGPAVLSPFFTATLASGPRPRHTALLRPFLRALLLPTGLLLALAALLGTTLWTAGDATGSDVAVSLVAALGTALLVQAAWLLGQLLHSSARWATVVLILALTAATLLLPFRCSPTALWPGTAGSGTAWAIGLLVAGLAGLCACVPLLDRLSGRVLAEQAARWDAAATMATSGDLTGAGAAFRALPTTGRRLPVIGAGPLPVVYARRDVLAWLRTPERSFVGLLGAVAGGALLMLPSVMTGPTGWAAAAGGALVLWTASGGFTDGIRHAVATLGSPVLFGQGVRAQLLGHAIAPCFVLVLAASGGAVPVLAQAAGQSLAPLVVLPLLVASLIVARAWAAAKGPMPLRLAVPMPTPQGDASVIPQLMWHSDSLWMALLLALPPLVVLPVGGLALAAVTALVLGALALVLTEQRLRQLRG